MNRPLRRWRWPGIALTAWGLAASPSALGEVIGTAAQVSARVQELIGGEPGSVSADDAFFDGQGELPIEVDVELTSTDLSENLVAHGLGIADFLDPERLDQANPEELALEAACYSNGDSASYAIGAVVSETRTLSFSNSEIDFGLGGPRDIESSVFFSGAVVLWSRDARVPVDALLADLRISVTHNGTGETLFTTALSLTPGEGESAAQSTGPIVVETVLLDELAGRGVDEDSLAVLRRVEEDGTLVVLVIPAQEYAYGYEVRADEPLDLTVRMQLEIRNAPGGTGVAAVVGRPFERLADFIERGLPGVSGVGVQRAVNESAADRGRVTSEPPRAPARTLCGAYSAELALLPLLALGFLVPRLVQSPTSNKGPRKPA